MYAVLATGGKQYSVQEGSEILVEILPEAPGQSIRFEDIKLIVDQETFIAEPETLAKAWIEGKILSQEKSKKIIVFKKKRRKNYRRKRGHRQCLTRVLIDKIHY